MPYVRVCVACPLPHAYDYYTPEPLSRGQVVLVPFGARPRLWGIVWSTVLTTPTYTCKPILMVLPADPVPEPVLALIDFTARYYHVPCGAVIRLILPSMGVGLKRLTAPCFYRVCDAGLSMTPWDDAHTWALLQRGRLSHTVCTPSQRKQLKRWVSESRVCIDQYPQHHVPIPAVSIALHPEQSEIVQALSAIQHFQVSLLYGITGSGKTHVYLAVMAAVLARGGQVLCLVPEIHLVPQWLAAIHTALAGCYCVVLHSGMSSGQRALAWQAAQRGFADIVIGTRLSVFTPLPRLAYIVIDEEHDPSYKQQDTVRYHARDVAIWRAQSQQVPILLGSATPSLETVRHCVNGRYQYHQLLTPAVPGAEPACLHIVPSRYFLSTTMRAAIDTHLARQEQILIFLNRRGYVPTLRCQSCAWVAECAHCSVRLVLHKQVGRLVCHHCGTRSAYPDCCPACGDDALLMQGYGTERLLEEVQVHWPDARVMRVDRDTTTHRGEFDEMRAQIANYGVDIIIGTQMLAKGHNFERLRCVAVAAIDDVLMGADDRREERLFALMMQVMGRVGRFGAGSAVYIQTAQPEHRVFQYLAQRDYWAFAMLLLKEREQFALPPYVFHALIIAESRDENRVLSFLTALHNHMRDDEHIQVYQPVPLTIWKKMDWYRAQLLIESSSRAHIHAALSVLLTHAAVIAHGVRYQVDVDPIEVM